ncbi:uncharacterized protein LOC110995928 isoform X2 [Pieris rapae]|uniref:uncharacterized protein LOC110995928 isoform X2 n=1 Tax=Pieris rapae TaxID=64459 RepID=UPI001E2815CD|nr:uncharacterized protein LOC110995928 isoform X2 [Pieris rapae]
MGSKHKIWTITELTEFAQKFQKVYALCNISWFHRGRAPLEYRHNVALKELACLLGESTDARYMEQRVYDFIGNMLHLMRGVAREQTSWESLPPVLKRLGTRLNLIDVASVMETGESRVDGAVNPAKMKSFASRLVKAVQKAVAERAKSHTYRLAPREWDTARFLKSIDAVEDFARETSADVGALLQIWLRMYEETRRELCRGGREPSLSLPEWRLADLLLLHEPSLPLLYRDGEQVCPQRSLRFLVRLVEAGTTRLPRREGDDPVFGASLPPPNRPEEALEYGDWVRSVWTAVHIAYCKKERPVSSVLLQRRWHQMRLLGGGQEDRAGPSPPVQLPRRFAGAECTAPPSWPSLVERGLVVDLTALGCQNPDLLCLLDDIEHASESETSETPSEAIPQRDIVRQLQAMDPSRAEVSILFDPHSDSETDDRPAPPAAPADKDDSLSFIIRQALNCRSVVRLQAPRLRELTDDILEKNSVLADEQTDSDEETPLVIDETKPEIESEARKRTLVDDSETAAEAPARHIEVKEEPDLTKRVKREKNEEESPGLSDKLAMEVRVVLERVVEVEADRTLRGLSPAELSRRHGVEGQGAAWWARNLPLTEKCRPLRVTLTRLRRRPAPRVALPDIDEIREINRSMLTAEVAPTVVRSPDAACTETLDVDDERPESRPFQYLYGDMLRMMARNAEKYLPTTRTTPETKATRGPRPEAVADTSQLSEFEKWEREKRVGLQYFSLPHLLDPEPRRRAELRRRSAPDPTPPRLVSESDSDSPEETSSPRPDERPAGILDDELRDLRRTEKGVRPRGSFAPGPAALGPAALGPAALGPAGPEGGLDGRKPVQPNANPVITCGSHSIRLVEDTRHAEAERKRRMKQSEREKRVKVKFTSILNEMAEEKRRKGRDGGAETPSFAVSRTAEGFAGASCHFKLPAERTMTAAEFAAAGGGGTALMRADLERPLWLVSREFVVLTRTPLTFARPSYWGAPPAQSRVTLTRVLFPGEDDRRDSAVVDLTDDTEPADGELPYKTLVDDPPLRVLVYNMVQDIVTFRRLNSSRRSLFLFSLRTGALGHLLMSESVAPAPEMTVDPALPVVSAVYSVALPSPAAAGPSSALREVSVRVPTHELGPGSSTGAPPVVLRRAAPRPTPAMVSAPPARDELSADVAPRPPRAPHGAGPSVPPWKTQSAPEVPSPPTDV